MNPRLPPTPAPGRRFLRALAVLVPWAAGACAPDAPGRVQRLYDLAPRAAVEAADEVPVANVLEGPEAGAWRAAVRLLEPPTEAEVAAFSERARVLGAGAVEIGAVQGSWVRIVPLAGPGTFGLRATVRVEGTPGGAHGVARVGLAELPVVPDDDTPLAELAGRAEIHWAAALGGPREATEVALLVRAAPTTRALAVVLGHRVEGAEGNPEPVAGARFEQVELVPAETADYAADLAGDGRLARRGGAPLAGGFAIARSRREALVLPPGDVLRLPLELAPDAAHLTAALGLVPHPGFPAGREVAFRVELAGPGGTVAGDWTMTTAGEREARWREIRLEVPRALRGERATLRASAVPAEPGSACLPVLATPRVVPRRARRGGPNVVVVSLDTLRRDRVGAYGCERDTTPHLDALAGEGWVFDDAWTQGPYTLPAHMSLFTGQHPSVHGVQREGQGRDPVRSPLLAEVLRAAGYTTAAFTGGGYVHPSFGFGAGFETYDTLDLAWNRESPRLRDFMREIPDVGLELALEASMERVRGWVADHADESFLLFFHTYAAHEFDPPLEDLLAVGAAPVALSDDPTSLLHLRLAEGTPERPLPAADAARLLELYDGAVHQADRALGAVVEALRAEGVLDETILVVLSDHGKEIGEHGEVGHGHTLYEELLQVPLVVRWPDGGARRVGRPAMLVDVVPTLLAALGLEPGAVLQGRDLRELPRARELFAEVDNLAVKAALRRGSLKTIWGPPDAEAYFPNTREEETYDLAVDPGEHAPLPPDPARARLVREHRAALRRLARELASGREAGEGISPALSAELQALGYQDPDDP